jgi:hypothetical protein
VDEKEWFSSVDAKAMLAFLDGKVSDRKLRLFAAGCCRRVWHLLADERTRAAVAAAERYADRWVRWKKLRAAQALLATLHDAGRMESRTSCALHAAAYACQGREELSKAAEMAAWAVFYDVAAAAGPVRAAEAEDAERASQCALLRDLFPFRPGALDRALSAYQDGLIPRLAQAIYDKRDPESGLLDNACLAVLADALAEAGCCDPAILDHCRQPGEHYRGCFVVDAILGKT